MFANIIGDWKYTILGIILGLLQIIVPIIQATGVQSLNWDTVLVAIGTVLLGMFGTATSKFVAAAPSRGPPN